jgi:hypothetical protein
VTESVVGRGEWEMFNGSRSSYTVRIWLCLCDVSGAGLSHTAAGANTYRSIGV